MDDTTVDQLERAYRRVGFTRAHVAVLAMVLCGAFFDAIEQNAVGIAGPVLKQDWGLSVTNIGLLNTATFTAVGLGRIIAGVLMDRLGRRRLLGWNLLLFAFGSLLCALAPNYELLLLARFLVGLGLGGEIAAAVVMLAEFFSARNRGTAISLVNVAAGGLGNMLAPLVGLIVFAVFTGPDRWRWLFAAMVIPAVLAIAYRRALPESPRFLLARGQVDAANTVFNRLAQGKLRGPLTDEITYLAPAAPDPTARPRPSGLRLLRPGIRRPLAALSVAVCMSYGAQFSMLTVMPIILTSRGLTISHALWFTLLMQSGSLAGALTAGAVARRFPRKLVLTAGATLGTFAALGFGFVAGNTGVVVLFGALFNFAVIVLNTTIWVFAPEQFPTSVRGMATATVLAIGSLSGGLFAWISSAVLDAAGVGTAFAMLSGLFLICGIAVQFPPETVGKPLPEDD